VRVRVRMCDAYLRVCAYVTYACVLLRVCHINYTHVTVHISISIIATDLFVMTTRYGS